MTGGIAAWWRRHRQGRVALAFASALIGALAALGALVFRAAIDLFQWLAHGAAGDHLASHTLGEGGLWLVAGPVVGGLGAAAIAKIWLPDGRPRTVPDVMIAAETGGVGLRGRDGWFGALHSAWSLGCGASLGREGPAVHLGAAIAAVVARWFQAPPSTARAFLGCGAAAAVAASFNAPLAGALFAVEVVTGGRLLAGLAPVVIAAAVGTGVGRAAHGDFPTFALAPFKAPPALEFPLFLGLGVGCGVAAAILIALTPRVTRVVHHLNERTGFPKWMNPVLVGGLLGLVALSTPEILGVGYEATDILLRGGVEWTSAATWFVVKFAAVVACVVAGFGGGVFSPSLFLGAALGSVYGSMAALLPGEASFVSAYAMAGAAGMAAAVLGAPVSTALIIFELTGNYPATVAALLSVVAATATARLLTGHSFFTRVLADRGHPIPIEGTVEGDPVTRIKVRDIAGPPPEGTPAGATAGPTAAPTIDADATLARALDVFETTRASALLVTRPGADGAAILVGQLNALTALRHLRRATKRSSAGEA